MNRIDTIDIQSNGRKAYRVAYMFARDTREKIAYMRDRLTHEKLAWTPLFSKRAVMCKSICDYTDARFRVDDVDWAWDELPGYMKHYVFTRKTSPVVGKSGVSIFIVMDDGGLGIEGRCPEPEDDEFKVPNSSETYMVLGFFCGNPFDTPLYTKSQSEELPDVKKNLCSILKNMSPLGTYRYASPDGKSKLVLMKVGMSHVQEDCNIDSTLSFFDDEVRKHTGVTDLLVK